MSEVQTNPTGKGLRRAHLRWALVYMILAVIGIGVTVDAAQHHRWGLAVIMLLLSVCALLYGSYHAAKVAMHS